MCPRVCTPRCPLTCCHETVASHVPSYFIFNTCKISPGQPREPVALACCFQKLCNSSGIRNRDVKLNCSREFLSKDHKKCSGRDGRMLERGTAAVFCLGKILLWSSPRQAGSLQSPPCSSPLSAHGCRLGHHFGKVT